MKNKNLFQYILGSIVVVCFFAAFGFLIYRGDYQEEVSIVLGAIVGAFTAIVSYYFGSSKGSADKNDIINKKP